MRVSFVLARAAVCLVALGVPFGCANKKQTSAQGSPAPALADLPEPAGLVAELNLAHPEAAYRALRELGSPVSALLPVGFPMFAATSLGLPPLSADSFDPEIAAVGSLARNSSGQLGWVVALHAVSGPELVAKLSTGDHAPFRARLGDPPGLTLLEPAAAPGAASPTPKPSLPLAVFDNYLLAAADTELLAAVGPYTARMLPRRPAAHAALVLRVAQRALGSALAPALRAFWASYRTTLVSQEQAERAAHGGRSPDFADPAQVILGLDSGVESVLSVIESAAELELTLDPFPNRLELNLLLTPATGSSAQSLLAALGAGDAQGLLTLPSETRFALGVSSTPADRQAAAQTAGDDWARLLGSRLSVRDAQTVRGVLSDWDLGRGARTSYGFVGGADPGVFVVAEVADAARLKRAGHGLLGLLGLASVRAPLAEFLGQPRVTEGSAQVDFGADVQLAKITFRASGAQAHAKSAPTPALTCAWFVEDKAGFAAFAKDATPLLQKVVLAARASGATLGASPGLLEGVQRIGDQAALFAYADARAPIPSAASAPALPPAPLFLSLGKRASAGFLRLEISKPAADLLLGRLVGL